MGFIEKEGYELFLKGAEVINQAQRAALHQEFSVETEEKEQPPVVEVSKVKEEKPAKPAKSSKSATETEKTEKKEEKPVVEGKKTSLPKTPEPTKVDDDSQSLEEKIAEKIKIEPPKETKTTEPAKEED